MQRHRKLMAKKLSRSEWYNADVRRKKWIDTVATQNYSYGAQYIESLSEPDFLKLKQRWSSYKHRSSKRSISFEATPRTFQLLKKLQKNRTLTETLESLINQSFNQHDPHRSIAQKTNCQIEIERKKCHEQQKPDEPPTMESKLKDIADVLKDLKGEIKELRNLLSCAAIKPNNVLNSKTKNNNSEPHKIKTPTPNSDLDPIQVGGREKW